jgi:hypothetical protein
MSQSLKIIGFITLGAFILLLILVVGTMISNCKRGETSKQLSQITVMDFVLRAKSC